ncbi:MAG TPA: hypothetical protein VL092_04920 [Chitinophagaceae bacterium]|nr:hypothetical protein [Chitinophagaceae bacterium]
MNRTKSIFATVLSLTLLVSCTKKPKDKPVNHGTPSTKLYPISSGNSWRYEVTTYDSLNNVTVTTMEDKVVNLTFVMGDTFYKIAAINAYYRSPDDGSTLIANSDGQVTTRYQYHNGSDSIQKIGELYIEGYINNYYSRLGTFTYKSYNDCFCFITQTSDGRDLTWVVYKYLKPGIGIVGVEEFSYSKDANGQQVYKLYRSSELKDYFLYP